MTATLSELFTPSTAPTVADFPPAVVLCDTRPARGKHRAPRQLPAVVLGWSRRSRGAFVLTGVTVGGLIAPVLLP